MMSWREWSKAHRFLAVLMLLFMARGVITTFVFPPFSGHDEVAHFAYLDFLSTEGELPIIPDLDDWRAEFADTNDQLAHDHIPPELYPFCEYVTKDWWRGCGDSGSNPSYAVKYPDPGGLVYYPSGWIYTANHPPLYYLTMLPVYWLSSAGSVETQLYALRLAAIPFGLVAIFFTFMTARVVFPGDRFIATLAPAFVGLQPQLGYEAAMLNNDIAAIALTTIVFYLLALGLRRRFPWRICVLTGLVFGLAMLVKNTSAVSGVVIAVAMILGIGVRNWRVWVGKGLATATIAGLVIWPWYLYMWHTYRSLTALDRISELQERWNYGGADPPSVWSQLTDARFAWDRWGETWGEFGWRKIPLDDSLLRLIFLGCALGIIGLAIWTVRSFSGRFGGDSPARNTVSILFLSCVVSYYAVLQFGTTFSLTQARYYFPAFGAVAILLALGYRTLVPQRMHASAIAFLFLAMVIVNFVIYSEYVIPYWTRNL
jgi:4-amino-4-deoxy-L-arabinose transferase-like glycosyltransferase